MAGIIFLKTQRLEEIKDFYINQIGMKIWLEQADCIILRHGNLLLGFCDREQVDKEGLVTFYYQDQTMVDEMYKKMIERAIDKPKINEKYKIYHFFARDPENRMIEFQYFLHPVAGVGESDLKK